MELDSPLHRNRSQSPARRVDGDEARSQPVAKSAFTTFVLAGLVGGVGMVVWPGCASVPLKPEKRIIKALDTNSLAAAQSRQLTQDEVFKLLGEPDVFLPELRVTGYRFTEYTKRHLILFLAVCPMGVERMYGGRDVAFFEFGQDSKVRRFELVKGAMAWNLQLEAKRWATNTAARSPR